MQQYIHNSKTLCANLVTTENVYCNWSHEGWQLFDYTDRNQ